jgi:hypothetical protein
MVAMLILASIVPLFAAPDPMTLITEKSCKCIDALDLTQLKTQEQRNMQLGFCVIKSAKGFEKYLKTEKNIDIEKIAEGDNGTRLGYLFALEAASVCPTTFAKIASQDEDKITRTVSGKIIGINSGVYTKITLEETTGKTSNLYWIFNFDNSNILLNMSKDKSARFEFSYTEKEIYFHAGKEYHKVKIISAVKKL